MVLMYAWVIVWHPDQLLGPLSPSSAKGWAEVWEGSLQAWTLQWVLNPNSRGSFRDVASDRFHLQGQVPQDRPLAPAGIVPIKCTVETRRRAGLCPPQSLLL